MKKFTKRVYFKQYDVVWSMSWICAKMMCDLAIKNEEIKTELEAYINRRFEENCQRFMLDLLSRNVGMTFIDIESNTRMHFTLSFLTIVGI